VSGLSVLFVGIVGGMIERVLFTSALPKYDWLSASFGGADTLGRGTLGRVGVLAHRSMLVAILSSRDDIMAIGGWSGFAYSVREGVLIGLAGWRSGLLGR